MLFADRNPLTNKTTYYKTVFYAVMSASIVIMLVSLWATDGWLARTFIFAGGNPNTDTFMDFFNSVVNTYNNPYDAKVIYPAICSLIYRLFLKLIMPQDFESVIINPDKSAQPPELKIYQSFMFAYIIFALVVIVLFFLAIGALMRSKGNADKTLMAFFCLFSAPFLFLIERGNILILSLVFTMLFIAYYDHKNKAVREIALICLAFAIAIKIYPVVFGVILLNEKKYKELIRAAIYTLIVFFVPFLFFGGIEGVGKFIRNLNSTSSNNSAGINRQLSFQKFAIYLGKVFGSDSGVWMVIGKVIMVVFSAVGAFCLFISKERWKTCALCVCLIVGVPSMSSRYSLTFLIIPIILLIMDEYENKAFSYVCLSIMSAIFLVKPIYIKWFSDINIYIGYKIDSFLYLALFIILCVNIIFVFVKRVRCKNETHGRA